LFVCVCVCVYEIVSGQMRTARINLFLLSKQNISRMRSLSKEEKKSSVCVSVFFSLFYSGRIWRKKQNTFFVSLYVRFTNRQKNTNLIDFTFALCLWFRFGILTKRFYLMFYHFFLFIFLFVCFCCCEFYLSRIALWHR